MELHLKMNNYTMYWLDMGEHEISLWVADAQFDSRVRFKLKIVSHNRNSQLNQLIDRRYALIVLLL